MKDTGVFIVLDGVDRPNLSVDNTLPLLGKTGMDAAYLQNGDEPEQLSSRRTVDTPVVGPL